jgi:hypothetical protein
MKELLICECCDDVKLKGHRCHQMSSRSHFHDTDWMANTAENDFEDTEQLLFSTHREYESACA